MASTKAYIDNSEEFALIARTNYAIHKAPPEIRHPLVLYTKSDDFGAGLEVEIFWSHLNQIVRIGLKTLIQRAEERAMQAAGLTEENWKNMQPSARQKHYLPEDIWLRNLDKINSNVDPWAFAQRSQ